MKSLLLRFLLGIFALGFIASSGFAQTHSGAIKALKVTGAVSRVDSTGATAAVTNGSSISESDTIVTGADSGVVLVFMNGSSVKLGANSRLLVEQFKMDPLAGDINVGALKKEPSVSKTALNLAYGELVGDVKKLNKSSTYNIKTPVGAAGIRGTQFRILVTPSADGKSFTFQLATKEGLVVFSGTAAGAAPVDVAQGTQVEVTAEVNTTTGAVTSSQVTSGAISAEAAAAVQSAVTEAIQQAQEAGVFTPTEQQSAGTGSGSSGTSGSGASNGGATGGDAAGADAPAAGSSNSNTKSTSNTSGTSTFTPPTAGGTGGTTVDKDGKPVVDGSPSN